MTRFLGIAIFLILAIALAIHAGLEFPWFLNWIGKLPGDVLIKKGQLTLYVPITSSVLIGAVLSLLFSFVSRK